MIKHHWAFTAMYRMHHSYPNRAFRWKGQEIADYFFFMKKILWTLQVDLILYFYNP